MVSSGGKVAKLDLNFRKETIVMEMANAMKMEVLKESVYIELFTMSLSSIDLDA